MPLVMDLFNTYHNRPHTKDIGILNRNVIRNVTKETTIMLTEHF